MTVGAFMTKLAFLAIVAVLAALAFWLLPALGAGTGETPTAASAAQKICLFPIL